MCKAEKQVFVYDSGLQDNKEHGVGHQLFDGVASNFVAMQFLFLE